MKEIKNIIIIGAGNVGTHLGRGFVKYGVTVSGVWSRHPEHAEKLAKSIDSDMIKSLDSINSNAADLVVLCVTDDAIASVLSKLPVDIPVAYTSGSVRLDQLPQREQLGVFYPLQTFSKERNVDLSKVPFLIESANNEFGEALFSVARKISNKVIYADSKDRYQLHIAAVMVNNFTNHIYALADDHMKKNHLDFDLLKPLINETVDKLNDLTPTQAQTGPAKRGDREVIKNHTSTLEGRTKKIYSLLSESIIESYKSKK